MIEMTRNNWEYSIDNLRYRPIGSSLPINTWRKLSVDVEAAVRANHRYPTEGCHGVPLERPDIEDRTDIP